MTTIPSEAERAAAVAFGPAVKRSTKETRTGAQRWLVTFHGRKIGAIGITYDITAVIWAEEKPSIDHARALLSDDFEHIHFTRSHHGVRLADNA